VNADNVMSSHETLYKVADELGFLASVQMIWEIGSRDGVDAIALSKLFPSSMICSFEPTPSSYDLLRKNTTGQSNIEINRIALGNKCEIREFYVNNPQLTETSWPDGNQGANSFYTNNPTYPYEKYVQEKIMVSVQRARCIIASGEQKNPDLIWMDVQGSELEVLKGFDDNLRNIRLIYSELSLKPLYFNAPLAPSVILWMLFRRFLVERIVNRGEWQMDVIFVNVRNVRNKNILRYFSNSILIALIAFLPLKNRPLVHYTWSQYWSMLRNKFRR
jgi:FkbM family methyltransferase